MLRASLSSVIGKIEEPRRRGLLDRGCVRDLRRGEYLFFKGDPARRVWSIESGVMKLCLSDEAGRMDLLGVAPTGDILGELAATDGDTQPFDAVAATPCTLISLDAALFMETVLSSPAASGELCAQMAARARSVMEAVTERTNGDITARLAGRLLDLAEVLGRMSAGTIEMEVPLAQEDIGRLAGMCRESTCRTMRRLKKDGILDYHGHRLRILRPDALERLRCGGRAARPSR